MTASILIVEDDKDLLRVLELDLRHHGYEVTTTTDGLDGLQKFHQLKPDLVMLDIALPHMDGLGVCHRIRQVSNIPILMMTGHAVSEPEIAYGLNLGADEYMVKPLGNMELQARVRALLRRVGFDTNGKQQLVYEDDYLSVNLSSRRVFVGGHDVQLTPTEFKLLATFITHPDEVMTFQKILEQVWGEEYKTEHHYPRIYVSHLRRKIEPDAQNPTYIHNEYGIGYRFVHHR